MHGFIYRLLVRALLLLSFRGEFQSAIIKQHSPDHYSIAELAYTRYLFLSRRNTASHSDARIQGRFFASDIKMYTGICLRQVPSTSKQYILNTSLVINNSNFNYEHDCNYLQTHRHLHTPDSFILSTNVQ